MYQTILDNVDADEFDVARPLWECARDVFMVDDDIAHDSSFDEFGVNVRLGQASRNSSTNLSMTGGHQFGRMLILLCVQGVGGEPAVDVLGVIGIELALYYNFRRGVSGHDERR